MIIKNIQKPHWLGSLFILTGFLFITSCSSDNGEDTNGYEKLVKTATVEEISSVKQKQFPGIIEEAEEVNLAFRVAGPIQKIHVKEGDYVKKGQLVAEMDTRDYEVQKNAIETQVNQLQSEYERIAELYSRKSVAENDYEKMKAGKEMAETQLKNAIDQLNDTKLYAPFSGYITSVMFEDGELVNHGTPIATLVDVSLLKVEINVPASLYINRENITNIECTQENIPNETFPLTLYADNIKANNNGLYKLYLYYKPTVNSKLAPGMNISVNISFSGNNSDLLSIPASALFEKDNNKYVWVVENSKVHSQKVETNSRVNSGNIEIVSGLKPGEQVVVGGLNLLNEDEEVKVVQAGSETNVGNLL